MANSPFNIIKTHLWSEVKEYTWGNLTIGRNYKTILGHVQSSQTTKKNNKKTFASTLLTGVGNVRKNLIRHYITGISVGSTAIRKTTRLLGSIVNVIVSTSKYIRSFVSSLTFSASSLATKLTVLVYTIPKTVIAGINLNSNAIRKTQSIVSGHVSTIGRTGRNVVKIIKSITLGLSESVRLSLRTIMSNVSLNSAIVRRLIKSLISYSVLNASTFRTTSKQIITSVLNSVFFMKLITRLINVQSYVIFTLKNNIYSTVGTLVNSYVVTVSKSAKQLNCNIQNVSAKLVFTARTVNTIIVGMANFLRGILYRQLLVATVNIVHNSPPIKWIDNKVRTWADLTTYRWHEFNDSTFATGVWKNVFRKISSSTNIVVNVKNNIKRLVTSYANTTSLIFRFVFRYVVSNVNSLSTSIRNVFKTIAVYILDLPVLVKNTWIKYQTNVLTAPQKINRTIKTFFIHLSTNSKLLRSVLKNVVSSVLNINIRTTNIKRFVTSTVTGIADLVCNYVLKKIVSTTVKLIYVVPSDIWGNLSTKTWSTLQSTYWWERHRIGIAGMQRRIERISIGTVNTIASPVKRNIGKIITGIKNITSQTKKSINRTIQSLTDSLNNVIKMLHREAISGIKVDAISYKGFFQSMLTYIATDANKYFTFFKIVSGLVGTVNTFISRFGKAVVQSITTIAVHSFNIFLSVVKEDSIKMSAIHKLKQEVIWRMGANARGETLHMVLGETKVIELTVVNEDGTPTDLDGADVKFAVSGAVEKDCGISDNKITVIIEPDDIKSTGTYDYEFRLKDIFNRVDSLIMGKIIVEPKVVSAY